MSALEEFLSEVANEDHAKLVVVKDKRVLYVSAAIFRAHLSTVVNLVHFNSEVDIGIVTMKNREKIALHPLSQK